MSSTPQTLDRLAKTPLLTPEEEIICGRAVQAMRQLLESNPDGPHSKQEKRVIRRGTKARDRLVTANLRWAFALARKYKPLGTSMTFDDLVQEATIGLIRAAEMFDPERGYKFSTYSFWWLRQGINRGLMYDRMIRLPTNASDGIKKIWKCKDHYQEEFQRMPSIQEISDFCGLTTESVTLFIQQSVDARSLDQKAKSNNEEASCISDLIACDRETPWDYAEEQDKAEWLEILLGKLKPQFRLIVSSRWGLNCKEPMSFTDMAEEIDPGGSKHGNSVLRKRLSSQHSYAIKQLRERAA